jgi:hypothetical protein
MEDFDYTEAEDFDGDLYADDVAVAMLEADAEEWEEERGDDDVAAAWGF